MNEGREWEERRCGKKPAEGRTAHYELGEFSSNIAFFCWRGWEGNQFINKVQKTHNRDHGVQA